MFSCRIVMGMLLVACVTRLAVAEQIVVSPGLYELAAVLPSESARSPYCMTAPRRMEKLSLKQIASAVEELTNLQVRIDDQAFSDAGLEDSLDQEVALWDAGETLERLASRISGDSGTELTWTSHDGVLTLTTTEKANERYTTARYFIGDLLKTDRSAEPVVELLQAETSGPWDVDEPGTGTSSELGGHLFIRQTQKVHREIEGLLAALRRTDLILLLNRTEADLRILKLLDDRRVSYDWPDITLGQFAEKLRELVGLPVELDDQALTEAGLNRDAPLSPRAQNLRLGVALREDLSNVEGTELTFVVRQGTLWLTTVDKANEKYETVVYNLESLGIIGPRIEDWIELVKSETTGPWADKEPGTGVILRLPADNHILIRQLPRVHAQIMAIISSLRSLPATEPLFDPAKPAATSKKTRFYPMNAKTAEALLVAIPAALGQTKWRVDSSSVSPSEVAGPVSSEAPLTGHITVVPVPGKSIAGAKETVPADPDQCFLAVTHTPDVHRQVVRVLKDLGVPTAGSSSGAAGGGFFAIPPKR